MENEQMNQPSWDERVVSAPKPRSRDLGDVNYYSTYSRLSDVKNTSHTDVVRLSKTSFG